ncbi:hypothetical protein SERLA73DRAFT_108813 [Serpula lacrymans var. lacrymans S7.3]|uniref:Major facilitator superfamily (MFS) profile domain-containing protein n=1 Tax=Serpula lacrymans var. lacrymans (strain S7.3) TaxID=936435 RepID=F8PX83_SERL3|nr:hypothetical protein SERLA73DRAFT_108813 [Serpula lacrymans var. lacrymans S7.3]
MPGTFTDTQNNHIVDEDAPLLQGKRHRKQRTPLPKLQIGILLLLQLAEPLASQSIYPFINQLIRELGVTGGDESKVGYYAGLIESLFFVTQALTVLQWNRLSDRIGRKPVILIGLFGLGLSMVCFGLSRTFWTLVVSRCICGMLNGNSGVMKSMMGELTDSTNMAQAFALIPIVWCAGAAFGPFMGGNLARPQERFPVLFSGTFWKEYPYFLPCAATACFTSLTFLVIVLFLKEVRIAANIPQSEYPSLHGNASEQEQEQASRERQVRRVPSYKAEEFEEPVPIRTLLTLSSVSIPIANYAIMALLEIALLALQPLFYSTPTTHGGIGFPPATIGTILGFYGLANGLVQMSIFAKVVERFGAKRVFVAAIACFLPILALFPVMSFTVRQWGIGPLSWALLMCQLMLQALMEMSYGCALMFVTSAAPNRRSLGAVNGIGQTTASVARAFGPTMSTSLFALSAQHKLMGGNAVYAILFAMSCGAIWLATYLPNELPKRK